MNSYKAHMKKETRQKGFTLVELLITMVVAIILLGVGIPAYNQIVANNRLIAQGNALVTAVNMAKSAALSNGISATLCADADTDPSTFVCSASDDWANGWFVIADFEGDGNASGQVSTTEVLGLWQQADGNSVITTNPDSIGSLVFSSLGVNETGALQFQIEEANTIGAKKVCITVNAAGLISRNSQTAACW